ncbi:helix-turn-helix domain-containing protein [Amycolatopsis vastitatis]|uniref:AraC family transcriptional regulator n=1 Tax=Amycolatopsis vastitatis TaxID=1905142 RepID=A0A229SL75_9PSEU|nr:AraC family transcriptional regulator [Amycolatopsis vastitatis]OXM59391.1 AraC family transcriptional regulator [Amycolatopsis vastitatis]
MDDIVRQAVARAIETMQGNLGERLTIDDLARAAMFSKFHFTRIFLRATGLSPGRFLSALRVAEAKRLLATTATSVADISHQVGYNSVGTFSARFSGSVGLSPTGYRQHCGLPDRLPERTGQPESAAGVRGRLWFPPVLQRGPVFVGLFPARIAEGAPARYAVVPGDGHYALTSVPVGSWYVIACAYGVFDDRGPRALTGLSGPVTVHREVTAHLADVRLRPRHRFDPPVLLALPELWPAPARRAVAV